MSRIFAFPNQVNEVSARLVAAGVVLLSLATIAFDEPRLLVLIAYGFGARVLAGPRFSPLALVVTKAITPRLRITPRLVPGPPKRFAQGIGAALSLAALVLALGFGQRGAAYALLGVLITAATLEAAIGFCLGCRIFALLMRAGVIPESICVECTDLWSRPAARSF